MLGAIAERAVALGGFWVKYLDEFLVRRPGGIDAASGTFFLGTRRETPVPDRADRRRIPWRSTARPAPS